MSFQLDVRTFKQFGLRPQDYDPLALPIERCPRCGAPTIMAWDDMDPDEDSPLLRRAFDLNPSPPAAGQMILWYQIDELGRAIGRQMFRRWNPSEMHNGDTWNLHAQTCPGTKGLRR